MHDVARAPSCKLILPELAIGAPGPEAEFPACQLLPLLSHPTAVVVQPLQRGGGSAGTSSTGVGAGAAITRPAGEAFAGPLLPVGALTGTFVSAAPVFAVAALLLAAATVVDVSKPEANTGARLKQEHKASPSKPKRLNDRIFKSLTRLKKRPT